MKYAKSRNYPRLLAYPKLERAKGFEPSTPTLARLCSTTELHPHPADPYHRGGGGLQVLARPQVRRVLQPRVLQGWPHRRIVCAMVQLPLTPDQLFARLDRLGIAHRTYHHPPVFTVAEAVALRGKLPGGHCKSLFLKDKKAGLWLVVALEERRVDLKRLADALGAPRFSFGNPELLYEVLGVKPGSVTPFAIANDAARRVAVVLDRAMLDDDPLNYHPLENDRTTAIAPADLLRFIADCGHQPRIIDLDTVARPA
jgi:Ala-tRNA(Pro) deacylase